MTKFTLKQHQTIEEVICASFDNEITIEDVRRDEGAGFMDDKGNETTMTWKEQEESYNRMGYWGFISDDNVINFWIKKDYKIPFEDLLFFLGHEMGHNMIGGTKPTESYYDNAAIHTKEEERADEYGEVAKLAYKFANKILNDL